MNEEKINSIINLINDLNVKYKENTYILQKLETHLYNLPNTLEQENKKHDERVMRINELTIEQNNFYKVFLSKYKYFYMLHNNLFYEYNGKTYKIIKEDDIYYKLLSTITDERKLIQWKHKTTQNIIKKIKERTLFKSTPETYTIQTVLGFLQSIFKTKTECKYFLTIIGDCILKKNNNLYFVSPNLKKIVSLIDSIVYVTTGNSIIGNFITKYHESHTLLTYRLIKNDTNLLSINIVKDILNNIGIDLFCVATHYSERYESVDNYLNTKDRDDIKNHVLYFAQNSLDKIISDFLGQCITHVSSDDSINWKNMHYIWKFYLSGLNIPNIVYSQQLQELLMLKLSYTGDSGNISFTNVTSKYLPNVSSFLSFWEKCIVIINDNDNCDNEYEIDELMTLYKRYEKKSIQLTEQNMIKMICHYYSPYVKVIDDKYITNIKCNLWYKNEDVNIFLESKLILSNLETNSDIISFDDLYQLYKNSKTKLKNNMIVSKQFFDKYITHKLSQFIKFEMFVSLEYFEKVITNI